MKTQGFLTYIPFSTRAPKEVRKVSKETELIALEELRKAREEAQEMKHQAEGWVRKQKEEIFELDKDLRRRESELNMTKVKTDQDRQKIDRERKLILEKKEEILAKLEKVAQISAGDAREIILKSWEDKLKGEVASRIKAAEERIKAEADHKAQEILIDAMRHGSNDYITEYTLSTVTLPDDSVKGRIIGKEGRNIRAFELATGVDVDLEEEGVIKISSFDALKREVAKNALERLIKDGRVQPVRIEEIVEETRIHIEKLMKKAGEDLVHRVGVYDLPTELVEFLGRFKYRFSYGQNMIEHTLEETNIGVALAHELKANVMTVKLGCLFHDIGKVVEGKEGSHVGLGVDLLKKYGMRKEVIHCVAAHHEDIPFESVEAVIVYIADAISGARPGARHEDFEQYLNRIQDIEKIAVAKKGVREAYALQAGRELRVVVRPDEISDEQATVMAEKIRQEINEKFPVFPGHTVEDSREAAGKAHQA